MTLLQQLSDAAVVNAVPPELDQDGRVAVETCQLMPFPGAPAVVQARASVLNNFGDLNAVKVVVTEDLVLGRLDHAGFEEIHETFVSPGDAFDSVLTELLGSQRFIVLKCLPGTGTRTAAMALIEQVKRKKQVRARSLGMGGPSGFPATALATRASHAYLMDLTEVVDDAQLSIEFSSELTNVSEILVKADSYLIILVDAEQCARISPYIPHLVRNLPPPDRREVARKRLRHGVAVPALEAWLAHDQILGMLDAATPGEAVEIAALIRDASAPDFKPLLTADDLDPKSPAGVTDFQLRVASVVARWMRWRAQLLDWNRAPMRSAFERSFLLTAAALYGFPVSVAYVEAKRLSRMFKDDAGPLSGHSGPGVIELLSTVGAEIDADNNIRFTRQRWAEAVLDYFWRDRPDGHDTFLKWLVQLPQRESFSSPEVRANVTARVVEVMSDLIMTSERVGTLSDVIDSWSGDDSSMRLGWNLLDKAALHPRFGRRVTHVMLRWSDARNAGRRRAVAAVCGLEFGQTHTDKALVRLGRLIADEDAVVVAEAERAVIKLWEQPSLGRELLVTLTTWGSDAKTKRVNASRSIFAKIAAIDSRVIPECPDLLVRALAHEQDLSLVAQGWRHLLEAEQGCDQLLEAVRPWLDAARKCEEIGVDALVVFEQAVIGGRRAQDRLQKCAYRWWGSTGERGDGPAGRLVRQIDQLCERVAEAAE